MNDRVAAVVVTYNRKKMLEECIRAILGQDASSRLDILVVDNCSTDGTYEHIREFIDAGSVIYENTGANLGGAGGFNYGMRLAVKKGYEYVWIMDDDCVPESTALMALMEYDRSTDEKYGFLSSSALWKDGSRHRMNIQRETPFRNVKDFDREVIDVKMASFVSLFVKADIIREFGLPLKDFFVWTDDWEFTRRISRKLPCYLVTKSVVIHKSNSNTGADISSALGEMMSRHRLKYRNDVYLYRREGIRGFLYEAARLVWHSLRSVASGKNIMVKLSTIWGGTLDGLFFHPEIERVD